MIKPACIYYTLPEKSLYGEALAKVFFGQWNFLLLFPDNTIIMDMRTAPLAMLDHPGAFHLGP
jgi:hypothetical protein